MSPDPLGSTFRFTETPIPSPWYLDGIVCSGGDTTLNETLAYADVTVFDGDDVTCTYTNRQYASKTGIKFNDLNANGVKDTGEPGLAGWRIYVDYGDDGFDLGTDPYDITNADGSYTITGINPGGPYKVKEAPTGAVTGTWTCSFPNPGSPDALTGAVTSTDCSYLRPLRRV